MFSFQSCTWNERIFEDMMRAVSYFPITVADITDNTNTESNLMFHLWNLGGIGKLFRGHVVSILLSKSAIFV